jgi:hypothetical protein
VIERIFGVLKRRFCILRYPAEIHMDLQARLPAALAAIHNFIRDHDPEELNDLSEAEDLERGFISGALADGQPGRAEREQANERRSEIASAMWIQYQAELQRRGDI